MKQSDTRSEVGGVDLGLGSVLYAVLGGPLAWTLHLFASYFLVTLGCTSGWRGADAAVVIAAIPLAAAAVASAVISLRRWRALGRDQDWGSALAEPHGRGGFLWLVGVMLGGIFALAIAMQGLAPLFVPTCGPGMTP